MDPGQGDGGNGTLEAVQQPGARLDHALLQEAEHGRNWAQHAVTPIALLGQAGQPCNTARTMRLCPGFMARLRSLHL